MEELLAWLAAVGMALYPVVRAWVKTKLTPEKLAHVADVARVAVRAAEKLAEDLKAAGVELPPEWLTWGEAKADFAARVIADGAKRLGVHLTPDEVLAHVHTYLAEMQDIAASVSEA